MFKLDDYYGEIIPLTEENPIKNGWLLPDGQFFICCFGGHSELLKNLVEEQVVERGCHLVKIGYLYEASYVSAWLDVDNTLQTKLTNDQVDFFVRNYNRLPDEILTKFLGYLKLTEPELVKKVFQQLDKVNTYELDEERNNAWY